MNKYLSFTSSDFDFLLDINQVVEIFDCSSSIEKIDNVLIGSEGDVYWRNQLGRIIDMSAVLLKEQTRAINQQFQQCYIVCRERCDSNILTILLVDSIFVLLDMESSEFTEIYIQNDSLNEFCTKLFIHENGTISFLLDIALLNNIPTKTAT